MISEELKARGEEALLSMLDGLEKAADFTVEQAPLVVQELLTWRFVTSIIISSIAAIVLIILIIGTIFCIRWLLKPSKKREGYENWEVDENGFVYGVITGLFWVFIGGPAIVAILRSLDWLQILIAPRLYLLEYAAELVK